MASTFFRPAEIISIQFNSIYFIADNKVHMIKLKLRILPTSVSRNNNKQISATC